MRRQNRIVTLLLILCGIAASAGWRSMNSSASDKLSTSTATTNNSGDHMRDRIEEKARKAKDNNESSIRELADEVFANFDVDIPSELSHTVEEVKDRVVRAEMKYRKGGRGLRESHIARTINELANSFNAPDYAKTSPLQVRVLRMELMKDYPSFIAQEMRREKKGLKKKVGDSINPEVSPLEGIYITSVLIWQKMLNDKWQQPPDEWAATLHQKHFGEPRRSGDPQPRMAVSPLRNDKIGEMEDVVARGLARLSIADAMNLVDSSLNSLGIEK